MGDPPTSPRSTLDGIARPRVTEKRDRATPVQSGTHRTPGRTSATPIRNSWWSALARDGTCSLHQEQCDQRLRRRGVLGTTKERCERVALLPPRQGRVAAGTS
jgi:hypothetical protein